MKRDLVFGRSSAMLVGSMLLPMLAYYFVKKQRKSTRRQANDIGASSSSPTSIGSNNYDVFLSFRGADTRRGFVDHLYNGLINAGIWVFKDENELREGEMIAPSLLQAIENSKISIPIFSPNYASSKWCLQELVQMLECKGRAGNIILPIFYSVTPAEVRYQVGSIRESFFHLSKKYDNKDVQKWRQALTEVSLLKGWEPNGYEGELVNNVVRKVFVELKKASGLVVTEELVGIDKAMEEVLGLLDGNPSATQLVGIYGMGGIGKTTLAKVVYNKLFDQFDHRSFIADIRESSKRNSISHLQNQLIYDILQQKDQVSNKDEGITILESKFRSKKVLILLDDVDANDQLKHLVGKHDWFGMGSKIIITTRLRSTLDEAGVACRYELKEIGMNQSLTLFSKHAFPDGYPPREFVSLSQNIVSTTRGLPLALEVIGSFLRGKNREFWVETLKKLRNAPHENVQEKLRISYDALNHEDQHIFLDISCLFIGIDVRVASYMWEACNLFPLIGIETLNLASLIKTGENQKLEMHDQLRDLGRVIARQEAHARSMNQSRLWDYGEALEVLQENEEENKNIEALRLDKNGSRKFMEQGRFKRFPNLKFLHVREVDFAENFKESLYKLRWLKWQRCPNSFKANTVHLEKLLILDLSGGQIRENWRGWSSIKMERLKVLNLSSCLDLKSTPNFYGFKNLEMLILENCENLEEIDHSIGDVKCLVSLNLKYCGSFKKLPDQLGELKELKELLVDETYIQEIPPCVRSLEKLKRVSAVNCPLLTKVPSSLDNLVSFW